MEKFSVAAFQQACGATWPLTLDLEGRKPQRGHTVELEQPFAIIGSHPRADAVWDDPQLNPRHVYLQIIGGSVFGIDLESPAGTRWGDHSRCFGWVRPDEVLALGATRVRVQNRSGAAPPEWNPLSTVSSADGPHTTVHLEIVAGKERPAIWDSNRVLFLIGRSQFCKVRLHDRGISRFHAAVVCTPGSAWIVDLLSRTGVFLNGQRVTAARLDPGDHLRLGPFLIRVQALEPSAAGLGEPADREPADREPANGSIHPAEIPGELLPLSRFLGEGSQSLARAQPNGRHPLMETLLLPLVNQFSSIQEQMFEQFRQNLLMMFQMFQVTQKEHLALVHDELRTVQQLTLQLTALQAELVAQGAKSRVSVVGGPARGIPTTNGQNEKDRVPAAVMPLPSVPNPHAATEEALPREDVHIRLCDKISALQQERASSWQRVMGFVLGK
jgi:pSer/pThr/pTyr-binding forkhead associated (FHA) protein